MFKKIKNPQVSLYCKLLIYTNLAQWNYGWDVLNIVQTYQSDLTQINLSHLYTCLHGRMVRIFLILPIHTDVAIQWFEFFKYYPYIQMWQYIVPTKYQLHIPLGL